jgi:hypothetical protein
VRGQDAPLTNTVTASSITAYTVNNTSNPSYTLLRGVTYVFQVNVASIHPFYIKTNFIASGSTDEYTNGVVGDGVTSGNLIFTVPANAPDTLFYHCGTHASMGGTLTIVTPPSPPTVSIVFISVSETGVMMQSTGTNNWTAIPEFNSNLTMNTWATVPNFTNTFANGTNTTTFNRLDAICGSNVFLRVRNQSQ